MTEKLSYSDQRKVEEADRVAYINKSNEFAGIIKPLSQGIYRCNIDFRHFNESMKHYEEDYGGFDLCPEYQRGHVWAPEQQLHFIENMLRGVLAESSFIIQFNCPNWEDDVVVTDLPKGFQCIDGLQRITAVNEYLKGNIKPFGFHVDDFNHSSFSIKTCRWRWVFVVHNFTKRADVLKHYLDINTGGTPHSEAEIDRVKGLLEEAKGE
jgi:hypothetical protein